MRQQHGIRRLHQYEQLETDSSRVNHYTPNGVGEDVGGFDSAAGAWYWAHRRFCVPGSRATGSGESPEPGSVLVGER